MPPPPAGFGTVAAGSLAALIPELEALGVDRRALLEAAGIEEEAFATPEARLPGPAAGAFWEAAVRLSGDPDLGLHLAERRRPGSLGLFDYLLSASPTLGRSLERAAELFSLVHGAPRRSASPAICAPRATITTICS